MSCRCGCCEGTSVSVPAVVARRPGLSTLTHRIGDHATFLETMLASLGRWPLVRDADEIGSWLITADQLPDPDRLVHQLSTSRDPAIADLWSRFPENERSALLDGGDVSRRLVDGLNSIIRGVSIFAPDRFAGRVLEPFIRELLAADDLTAVEGQQLNRLLIEVVLGRRITPVRVVRPLDRLTTRDTTDFSIALLDAWAVVGDIVTFYQERFVDEAYLRTATERRSILELARLIGYELRPGVASGAFLAFTLQDGHDVEIPAGTLTKSTPEPGEPPQPFETSEPLKASARWNLLRARQQRPQVIELSNASTIDRILVQGTNTKLAANDVLLLAFGSGTDRQVLRTVLDVRPDEAADRTEVRLQGIGVLIVDRARLRQVLARFRVLPDFHVDPGVMANEMIDVLDEFEASIAGADDATLLADTEALIARVEKLHNGAAANEFNRLEVWLRLLARGLASAVSRRADVATDAGIASDDAARSGDVTALDALLQSGVLTDLRQRATVQPANRQRLAVDLATQFDEAGDLRPRLLSALRPAYRAGLYQALAGATVAAASPVEVYAFRVRSPLYGHNAPERPYVINPESGAVERLGDPQIRESTDVVDLAAPHDGIVANSWVVVRPRDAAGRAPDPGLNDNGESELRIAEAVALAAASPSPPVFARVAEVDASLSRADYGISSPITRIRLADPADPSGTVAWFPAESDSFGWVRGSSVLAQAELLDLADEPIETVVDGDEIELDRLHEGLEPGRWVIVSGERVIEGVDGVEAAELAMLAGVEHRADPTRPGEQIHTFVQLAGSGATGHPGLSYVYRRSSVRIYGNVVRGTNGETNRQVLGSGDGRVAHQSFTLRGTPLTHVSAPTPCGSTPELDIRVNGVRWHRTARIGDLDPGDRGYVIRTDDGQVASVVFGDGVHGARLPTGAENVEASYRIGLGLSGNVRARTIDTLIDRPLGVREVINPIEAAGGADRERMEQARRNAPAAVMALDRLVAVRDYADFARTFAGVDKADARLLPYGGRRVVHLTVGLAGAAPFDPNTDLYRNLRQALADYGDPRLTIRIDDHRAKLVVVSAGVRIHPDHTWELVEPRIRDAIASALGYDNRDLGRGLASSEVISVIDGVRGVEHVDLDAFDWVDEQRLLAVDDGDGEDGFENGGDPLATALRTRIDGEVASAIGGEIVPGALVYADPGIRSTVVLQEVQS